MTTDRQQIARETAKEIHPPNVGRDLAQELGFLPDFTNGRESALWYKCVWLISRARALEQAEGWVETSKNALPPVDETVWAVWWLGGETSAHWDGKAWWYRSKGGDRKANVWPRYWHKLPSIEGLSLNPNVRGSEAALPSPPKSESEGKVTNGW